MSDPTDHDAIAQLLPFYLNGRLSAAESERVEAALAASPHLRAELEEQRALMAMVKAGGAQWAAEARVTPPEVERAEPRREPAAPKGELRGLLGFLSPANWRPAVGYALALAALLQAGALVWQDRTIGKLKQENYQLASGQNETAKGAIIVELQESANWGAVVGLLQSEGLTIVGGGDFGTLQLGSARRDGELNAQIERLRASPLIASADPAA